MRPAAAKEKIRSSGPTRSYLQTRVRGQRLQNAALLLALIELTRRLHQAYAQAYDKQAADWLLPQNPPTLPDAINAARNALETDACKNLFSKGNGLAKLNELAKKNRIKVEDTKVPKELITTGRLKDAPGIGEAAKGGKVFINPNSPIMKGTYKYDSPVVVFSGMKPEQALATLIIHGVLHVTKDIAPDGKDPNASRLHNIDVRDACFPKPNP